MCLFNPYRKLFIYSLVVLFFFTSIGAANINLVSTKLRPDPFIMYWWKTRARIKMLITGNSLITIRWGAYHMNYEKKKMDPLFANRLKRKHRKSQKMPKNLDDL
jgi:hypothetical protein